MRGKDNPCYGCTEATGITYNYHTLCDGYKQFQDDCKAERDVIKRKIYEKKCFEQEQEGKKMIDIGENIREIRKLKGMTQKELAKKTSLSIASIQGYEQKNTNQN